MATGDKIVNAAGAKMMYDDQAAKNRAIGAALRPEAWNILDQVTDYGYAVNSGKNDATKLGKRYELTGSSASVSAMSGYIPVFKGQKVVIKNMRATDVWLVCAFYAAQDESTYVADDEDNVPKARGSGAGTNKNYEYTFPSDGYIRISCRTDVISSAGTTAVIQGSMYQMDGRLTEDETAIAGLGDDVGALEAFAGKTFGLIKYVSPTGSDDDTGDSTSHAYATVGKALREGATVVKLAKGEYSEIISDSGVAPKTIIGYGAEFVYDVGDLDDLDVNTDDNTGNDVRTAITFKSCKRLEIYGITVTFTGTTDNNYHGFLLSNAAGLLVDCQVQHIEQPQHGMGFRLDGSKVTLIRCRAAGSYDGFNAHDTDSNVSEGTFIDCVAADCKDDGLSYHEHGIIHVHGGRFTGCAQTGIAPNDFCCCEIRGAYIAGNGRSGLEAIYSAENPATLPTMILAGCIFEDNVGSAVEATQYVVKSCGNGASGNGTDAIVNGGGSTIDSFGTLI